MTANTLGLPAAAPADHEASTTAMNATTGRLPTASARQVWHHARSLLRARVGALTATTVLLLAGTAAALVVPIGLGAIVDATVDHDPIDVLVAAVLTVVAAGILSALLLRWGGRLMVSTLQSALAELREAVFRHAMHLDQNVIEDAGSADVVSRVTGDIEAITDAVSDVLPRFVQAGFTIALTAVGLATLNPWLAGAALLAVPVQIATTARFLRASRPIYARLRVQESDRGQAIIEALHGADTIAAYGEQQTHLDRVADRSLTAVETSRAAGRARNRFNAGLNVAEFIGLAAILCVGFWQSTATGLTVGAVTAAALLFHRLFGPIGALLSSLDDLQRAGAGLSRVVGVLVAPIRGATDQPTPMSGAGVRLSDVSHRYAEDAPDAVSNLTLNLPEGSTTLLVGESGSGKSTVAQLIAGAFEPTSGSVMVAGSHAASAAASGRRQVQLVTQDTHVFVGTLADNLRLAAPSASDAELRLALDEVGAHWGAELADGIDTVLHSGLDAARVQQIALARVLLADPAVVVLDEATAHGGTDGALDDAVLAVIRGRTAVIVAHRLTHAVSADLIVVLEDGRLREAGSYADLLARPQGAFASLHAAATAHT